MSRFSDESEVIFVDREILLSIYPFEIKIRNERLRGSLEFRNDGNIKFLWQSKPQVDLNIQELQELAILLIDKHEAQSEAELRKSVKQELVEIILNDNV